MLSLRLLLAEATTPSTTNPANPGEVVSRGRAAAPLMYRKRAASLGAEVLQRQMDFELFSNEDAAESKKCLKTGTKLQKKDATKPDVRKCFGF